MIIRNCAATLGRALQSVAGMVDEVVLVDTGSTDNTLGVVDRVSKQFPAVQWKIHQQGPAVRPEWFADGGLCKACRGLSLVDKCWKCLGRGVVPGDGPPLLTRFDAARNYSWEHASGAWRGWLDSDDVVRHASPVPLRKLLDLPDAYGATVRYLCAIDAQGVPAIVNDRIRWARGPWIWKGRLHETLHQDVSPPHGIGLMPPDMQCVLHQPTKEWPRIGRDLAIMNVIDAEDGTSFGSVSLRAIYAAQYFRRFDVSFKLAEEAFLYHAIEGIQWYQAAFTAGAALREMDRFQEALEWYERAIDILPNAPDAYYGRFLSYAELGEYEAAFAAWDIARAAEAESLEIVPYRERRIDLLKTALQVADEWGDPSRVEQLGEEEVQKQKTQVV